MPTYEYVCNSCEHKFEYFQNMNDELLKTCPQCEESSLKRLIGSGAGIIFKGSGFYCTDYRSANYNSDKKQDKKEKTSSTDKKNGKKTADPPKKTKPPK